MRSSVKSFPPLLFVAVLILLLPAPARADIIYTFSNTTVTKSGVGTVDIFATSNNPSGDNLTFFSLELMISVNSGTSLLQFTNSQPDPTTNSLYVFAGPPSVGGDAPGTFWGPPSSTFTANDTIVGGDYYFDFVDSVTLTPSTNYLLGTVQFQADNNAIPGDSFAISLIPDQTYFQDANGDSFKYSGNSATITVEAGSSAAVPEPGSMVLCGFAMSALGLTAWRRRKNPTIDPAQPSSKTDVLSPVIED